MSHDAKYSAMRALSQMIQNDPDTPDEIRTDFAIIDKAQDLRDFLGATTEKIFKENDQPELKKEFLEYLTLTECGIRSFLDAHGLTIPEEQK